MATELKMTLLLRRAEFADSCVLQLGEPGYHTSTKEFKVGDGSTTWKELPIANKTQIEAIVNAAIAAHAAGYYTKEEINTIKKALEKALEDKDAELLGKINENASAITTEAQAREAADTLIRTDFAAADATTLASAQSYADTKKAEVIGDATSTKDSDTVKGAKLFASDVAATAKAEAISAAAADATSKANAAEAAAKSHAETKATAAETAAKSYADAQDTALAQTVANNLSNAVSALETKITNGDSATLKSAKDYADEQVAAEAELRIAADNALDGRLDVVEAKLTNVSNVMDFVGAADALPAEGNNQSGDVIVITAGDDAGKEFVYDDSREAGKKWVEFGSTSATDAAVASLKSRMDAAEDDIDQAQADILALGTNKMDKSAFNTWEEGFDADKAAHELDHAKKQAEITADIATAKSEAITEAGKLDTALHTVISKEIDDDVKAAIDAEVIRANGAYDATGSAAAAQSAAIAEAGRLDATLKTAIEGTSGDASSVATIAGAKKYAEEKAAAAQSAAEATAAADATSKANAAQAAAEATATSKANAAESNAKSYAKDYADTEIGKEKTRAEGQEAAIRSEFAAADTATLTSAKAYVDEKVTDAHKNYQTATVKDAAHDSATNPSFITSISIDKGHVTGATVRNLAEVLEAMTFIFDGGTSAN